MENPFNLPISGQASWDDDIDQALQVFDRGFHITERAGQAISSGQMVAMTSGGWMLPFNPASSLPCIGYSYLAASSGDSLSVMAWGAVRSLSINSPVLGGQLMFSNASGFLSVATLGAPVGVGLMGRGILFKPSLFNAAAAIAAITLGALSDVNTTGVSNAKVLAWSDATSKWVPTAASAITVTKLGALTDVNTTGVGNGKILVWDDTTSLWIIGAAPKTAFAQMTDVNTNGLLDGQGIKWSNSASKWVVTSLYVTGHRVQSVQISAAQNSLHTFTMSLGDQLYGWNRRVRINGASMASVELKFYRDAGLTDLQYQSASGGVSAVGSFHDRAGWPVDTDSGTIYGTLFCNSTGVATDTINIICDWER